jgi:alpha-L-fucosidase 2
LHHLSVNLIIFSLKNRMMKLIAIFLLVPGLARAQADVELRFADPALQFTQSSPLGNGRLGAMVFGNPGNERIVLNEISMWSGGLQNPNRPDAHQYLAPIQQLLLQGKNVEAQQLLQQQFVCAGKGTGRGAGQHDKYGCYQTLGDCWIHFADTNAAYQDYSRVLRLDSAISTTTWKRKDVGFAEQVIVSAPQQAIIIRLTATRKGGLTFTTGLSRKERATLHVDNNRIIMTGQLEGGDGVAGISYAGRLQVLATDGKVTQTTNAANAKGAATNSLTVQGATECLLIVTAGTDMNWPHVEQRAPDPLPAIVREGRATAALPWASLLQQHVADFQSFFDRCRLKLDDPDRDRQLPLARRLANLQEGKDDPSLVALYFNFGRYLLISSSRSSLPSNLQGLWAEEYQTPWNGDYHTNINIQMNYWLTDAAGLPECQTPVFQLLQQMAHYGRATAKSYYNADGWVTHSITNPWGFTAPGEGAEWGSSLTGGAWLATHLLRHYQYYPDTAFLHRYYPVLKGAAQFFTRVLIREPNHHWLVTAPSNSPENSYVLPNGDTASTCMGPTMDMQIARELLTGTAAAAHDLGIDLAWADSLQAIARQLAPNQVSTRTGGIQEWLEDYQEVEPHHRHVSPLYGLYPYDEITPWGTPQLAEAARKTLIRRGDEGTGWSRAWKIAFWARLGDGDHAYTMLKALWKPAGKDGDDSEGAGTYPNLFDACPPFQIDGNFGATAAIMELFLQSQGEGGVIRPLPALPHAAIFQNGGISGIHARGGFAVDLQWTNGKVSAMTIHSDYGRPCHIAAAAAIVTTADGKPVNASVTDGILTFSTAKGGTYKIDAYQLDHTNATPDTGAVNTAIIPVPKLEQDSYNWWDRHAEVLRIKDSINPEIILIGNSITHFWGGLPVLKNENGELRIPNGPNSWANTFGAYRVLNLGFGWDRTQNVLWRLDHGEMDKLSPRVVIVEIGTNNTSQTEHARMNTAAEIAEGVAAIVRRVQALTPNARIILMAILPREQSPQHPRRLLIDATNKLLAGYAMTAHLTYLDVGAAFLAADGTMLPGLTADFTHPTDKGYQIWADAIRPYLAP